jgi:hypothetical protein
MVETATPSPSPTPVDDTTATSIPLEVWFHENDGRDPVYLVPSHTLVIGAPAIGRFAIETLLTGPAPGESKRGTSIPEGTELLGLTIENGIATVDLSAEFNDTGLGTSYEHLPLAQVVFTLTQFDTVDAVAFEIEGKRIKLYGGHGLAIEGPLRRKDFEDSAPPIIVDSPYPREQIDTTFTLEGTANVFEATVSYRIVDKGGRGDYSKEIKVDVTEKTRAVIEVFESSAEDGSPLHLVRVPVTIVP